MNVEEVPNPELQKNSLYDGFFPVTLVKIIIFRNSVVNKHNLSFQYLEILTYSLQTRIIPKIELIGRYVIKVICRQDLNT